MKITLKDGVVKEFDNAVSVLEIAKSISEGLARNACAGLVNGEVKDKSVGAVPKAKLTEKLDALL